MLIRASFPNEPFNSLVRKGTAGEIMVKIIDSIKPESIYFTDMEGMRTALLIVTMENDSQIPAVCEPFFLNFNALIHLHPVMTPDELHKAGLMELGKKWG
jgi:hypothetical protein